MKSIHGIQIWSVCNDELWMFASFFFENTHLILFAPFCSRIYSYISYIRWVKFVLWSKCPPFSSFWWKPTKIDKRWGHIDTDRPWLSEIVQQPSEDDQVLLRMYVIVTMINFQWGRRKKADQQTENTHEKHLFILHIMRKNQTIIDTWASTLIQDYLFRSLLPQITSSNGAFAQKWINGLSNLNWSYPCLTEHKNLPGSF